MQAREKTRELTACDEGYEGKCMEAAGCGPSRSRAMQATCGQHNATLTEAGTHLEEVQISRTHEKAQTEL
jgi:hypothetical protein